MNTSFEMQNDNRIKAMSAFNDFMDCFIKADPNFKQAIGNDVYKLMLLKSNTDEAFNEALKCAIDIANKVSRMRNR